MRNDGGTLLLQHVVKQVGLVSRLTESFRAQAGEAWSGGREQDDDIGFVVLKTKSWRG